MDEVTNMNVVFWILIFLAALAVWAVATASLFSARVGKIVVEMYESITKSMDVERENEDEKHW